MPIRSIGLLSWSWEILTNSGTNNLLQGVTGNHSPATHFMVPWLLA